MIWWGLLVVVIGLWLLAQFHFRTTDLRAFDEPRNPPFAERAQASEGRRDVLARIATLNSGGGFGKKRLQALRAQLESLL